MYQAIFLDIDDTLLDFKAASESAFYKSFERLDLYADDEIYQKFQNIDRSLWIEQKAGKISVQDVINLRFKELFSLLDIDLDAMKMRDLFQSHLSLEAECEDGAYELLEYLYPKYQLYAASNGIFTMQYSRLKLAKLLPYFSGLFISDDIGYEKPNPHFFEICLQKSQASKADVLLIGDSLEADIKGAMNSGIDACWYNSTSKVHNTDYSMQYTVNSLLDLTKIL